ncbi:unnamed protein product [Urochloa decumbens]|uniref:BZIP domain-containing protein n=1 Tax=Urochloa decumbens TaxID=240449 RepID=A0ABC9GBE9_9POAL
MDEAMELDFAGALPGMDVGSTFDFDYDAFNCGAVEGTGNGMSPVAADASTTNTGSGADDGQEEERRRRCLKRKISNRESARRSRARRRQRAEDLERAAEALRAQRKTLAARRDAAAARALAVRLDNARLAAEACALRRRLGEAQRQAVLLLALARARLARAAAVGVAGAGGRAQVVTPQLAGGGSVPGMMTW